MADAQQNRERTDRELLQSFVAHRDQAAFATLLQRHGPMVLRVCRHVLRQEQDAEDAFQAAFLLLARRANSIRKQEALASWLYGVAHHVALRARRDATRRRAHEREAQAMAAKTVTAEVDWREAQAVLEEEIRNLPERCRAAFVLCFLEGKSRAETARELGVKEGTVWSRLAEARQLLQRGLLRRGISLTAVLGAAALSEGVARAVPARLITTTVQVAADTSRASARVAALAEGVNQLMISTKLKSVILCLITAGLVCLGTAVAGKGDATGQPPRAPRTEKKAGPSAAAPIQAQARAAAPNDAADKKAEEFVKLSGRILGPDGRAVAGAEVTLWWHFGYDGYYRDWHPTTAGPFRPKPLARSGADGRFTATFRKSELTDDPMGMWNRPWRHALVVAAAPGYGPLWASVAAFNKGEMTLRLVEDDVPVKGRILSLEGRPVAGVAVRVVRVTIGKDVHHSLWQTTWAGLPQDVKTGPDGRFTLRGLGRDRTALLSLEGPATEHKLIGVNTAPVEGKRESEVFLEPTRPVEGTVRDKTTGRPVAGVVVYGDEAKHHRLVRAVSDARGHYRLVGLPSAGSYRLTAYPPVEVGYLSTVKPVAGRAGLAPLKADVEVRRGVKLSCRLVDRRTRQPVRGVLQYTPIQTNPFYAEAEETVGLTPNREFQRVHMPDPAGVFHLVVYPGPGLLTCLLQDNHLTYLPARLDPADLAKAQADVHVRIVQSAVMAGYRLIEPKATDKRLDVEIELDPGRTLKGSLIDSDGKPLTGAVA
jgi:RNA polymerase sigma factor (sigma-70 family)